MFNVNYSFKINKYISFDAHLNQTDSASKEPLLYMIFFVMKRVHPAVFLMKDVIGIQGKIEFSRELYHKEVSEFIKTVFSANHRVILEFPYLSSEQKRIMLQFCQHITQETINSLHIFLDNAFNPQSYKLVSPWLLFAIITAVPGVMRNIHKTCKFTRFDD